MPTSNERKMLSSNEALKELRDEALLFPFNSLVACVIVSPTTSHHFDIMPVQVSASSFSKTFKMISNKKYLVYIKLF